MKVTYHVPHDKKDEINKLIKAELAEVTTAIIWDEAANEFIVPDGALESLALSICGNVVQKVLKRVY